MLNMRTNLFLILVAILESVSCWNLHHGSGVVQLAVIGERPLSIAKTMVQVPLVLMPNNDVALYSNVHISSVSPTEPLVTCKLNHYSLDATPAVKVVLRRPIIVESAESFIPFPASVGVVHEGLRMSIPVGALIAPIPGFVHGPQAIRVIYAIPTTPLNLRYPYYSPVPYPFRPTYEDYLFELKKPSYPIFSTTASPVSKPGISSLKPVQVTTTRPVEISTKPTISTTDLAGLLGGDKKPTNRPLVTVLDFPSELASPASLYYQPTIEDELGNRGPPEAIIPAGIVQSTQPRPTIQLFLNAKESALLQALRDEAEAFNKDNNSASLNSIKVEAL